MGFYYVQHEVEILLSISSLFSICEFLWIFYLYFSIEFLYSIFSNFSLFLWNNITILNTVSYQVWRATRYNGITYMPNASYTYTYLCTYVQYIRTHTSRKDSVTLCIFVHLGSPYFSWFLSLNISWSAYSLCTPKSVSK